MIGEIVREIVEEVFGGAPFKVGDEVKHPSSRIVRIVDGQFMGTHGVSNHWTWKEILPDGSLGEEEHGYGWRPEQLQA